MIKLPLNSIEANHHFNIIKDLIQNRIKKILKKGIKKEKKKITLNASLIAYLNSLLDDTNLKSLITSKPNDLITIILTLKKNHPAFFDQTSNENFILRNIFINHCYDNKSFIKLDFIKRKNIDTCPYCNRNYIYYLPEYFKIKPPIDHFFPKSKYPIIAASYYNLIPSCQTCNGFDAKGEKDPFDEGLINPHILDNDKFKFTYKIKSISFLNPLLDKTSVKVKFSQKIPGHLKVFKLDKLYEQHSDHVLELIIKSKIKYSERYRTYLKSYHNFSFNKNEIDRMIIGNFSQESEIHKRPLAKLYQDISKELGLIK